MNHVMHQVLGKLGLTESNLGGFNGEWLGSGSRQQVVSPVDGELLAEVVNVNPAEFNFIRVSARLSMRCLVSAVRGTCSVTTSELTSSSSSESRCQRLSVSRREV